MSLLTKEQKEEIERQLIEERKYDKVIELICVASIILEKVNSLNTIKHAPKGKYKKEIDAIINKSSKVRK